MTVKERIISLRLIEKQERESSFFKNLGVETVMNIYNCKKKQKNNK